MLLAPKSTAVVVVAGLPGAGKTTLVASEPRALDSDAVREAGRRRLAGVRYPLWRSLVTRATWQRSGARSSAPRAWSWFRPFTRTWLRRAVLRRARRHHAEVHLVVVDATPEQARAGQRARGRRVSERAMRGHEDRWAAVDLAREEWTTVSYRRGAEAYAATRSAGRERGRAGGPGVANSGGAMAR